MILSLDEMHKSKVPNDFEYTAQERQSTRFSLGGKFSNFDKKIMCYIRQKISEYHDNLWVDDTLSTSTTQKYIKAKNKHDKERTIQEVKEKMKSLPELEFVWVQRVDFTNIDHSILIEYNIVRDLDGMAEISGDTLRNMWLNNNKDPYGRGIYRYAETRAKLMQKKISQWATLKDIAMSTSYDADTEWIFWFMKSAAKSVLIQCRKYWSELQDIKS